MELSFGMVKLFRIQSWNETIPKEIYITSKTLPTTSLPQVVMLAKDQLWLKLIPYSGDLRNRL